VATHFAIVAINAAVRFGLHEQYYDYVEVSTISSERRMTASVGASALLCRTGSARSPRGERISSLRVVSARRLQPTCSITVKSRHKDSGSGPPQFAAARERDLVAESKVYEAIFNDAPDALLIVDERGLITAANAQAEKLFGWSPEQLRGSPLARLVPERFHAAHDEHVHNFFSAPKARPMGAGLDLWAKRADGREFPVEISLSPVRTEHRTFVAAAVRNVSSQQERFRLLVEGVRDYALYMVDSEGYVISWNAGAEHIKGYSAAEALGMHFSSFYAPEDRSSDVPETILRRAAKHGHSLEEGWRLRKDGSRFWATIVTTALYDHQGQLRGFSKLVRDETERQLLMRERERALRWFRTVIDTCPVGLLLFEGPAGDHVEANSAAVRITGRQPDPDLGCRQYIGTLCYADGRTVPTEQLPSSRALGGQTLTAREEYLFQRFDGTVISSLISAAPLLDVEGRVAGAIVVFDDITELATLKRMREQWTSVVAHDLRQPVSVISTHAQLVDLRKPEDEQVKKAINIIGAAARRLDRMIHDLLDLERLEASKLSLERRPLEIETLVRAAADNAATVTKDRRVLVSVHGKMPTVSVDQDRIHQVLDNLLTNAVRYGDPDTDVTVDIEGTPDGVAVSVTNRGPGIAPELMPALFRRFGRQATGTVKRESLGLGLYIAKGLVEAHGGNIEVTSVPGATTTFRFTLPAMSPQPTR
jgi:PAS domain S-box-containing protein